MSMRSCHVRQPLRGRMDTPARRNSLATVRWCTPNSLAMTARDAPCSYRAFRVSDRSARSSSYSNPCGTRRLDVHASSPSARARVGEARGGTEWPQATARSVARAASYRRPTSAQFTTWQIASKNAVLSFSYQFHGRFAQCLLATSAGAGSRVVNNTETPRSSRPLRQAGDGAISTNLHPRISATRFA
jgi:hypothetical protein